MKKTISAVSILFFFACTFLVGQTPEPHYVIIDDARAEITRLQQENEAMGDVNATLLSENADLENQIASSREFIVRIDDMIDKIVSAKGPIYTAQQSVNDPATKRELQNKMNDLRESEYELEKTRRQEIESMNKANQMIETNRRMIAVNNVRTKSNEQRIEFLRACEAYTLNENRDVDDLLSNADQVRREVEALLDRQ